MADAVGKTDWVKVGKVVGSILAATIAAGAAAFGTYLTSSGASEKARVEVRQDWEATVLKILEREENTFTSEEVIAREKAAVAEAERLRLRAEKDAGVDGKITTLQLQVQDVTTKQGELTTVLDKVQQSVEEVKGEQQRLGDEVRKSLTSIADRVGAEPPPPPQ